MQNERRLVIRRSFCFASIKSWRWSLCAANGENSKTIWIRCALRLHRATNYYRRHAMTIRNCRSATDVNPSATLKKIHAAHSAASVDCIWAQCVARATNCAARYRVAHAASRPADADRAEACCFRQSCPARYGRRCSARGRRGQLRRYQDPNRVQRQKYGQRWSRGLRRTEISASRCHFPACVKFVSSFYQTLAGFRKLTVCLYRKSFWYFPKTQNDRCPHRHRNDLTANQTCSIRLAGRHCRLQRQSRCSIHACCPGLRLHFRPRSCVRRSKRKPRRRL